MKKVFIVAITLLGLSFAEVSTATICGPVGTGTPGYWLNHPEAWPVSQIIIHDYTWNNTIVFSKEDAIELMSKPVKGDKWLTMFSAFVAAALNVANGNCNPTCYSLAEVEAWLYQFYYLRPIEAKSEAWQYSHGEALYWCLDGYNNGLIQGIPSRDSLE